MSVVAKVQRAEGARTATALSAVPARDGVRWPEALMEALGLGLFMVSAGGFGTLLESPHSPVHLALGPPTLRRLLMGLAMGLTAIGLVYSPWGRRSGAHINPAFTLTMFRLGRMRGRDAAAYALAQFAGGLAGVLLVAATCGSAFSAEPVAAVVTRPGASGDAVAFLAEVAISFVLVSLVLMLGRSQRLSPFTGCFVGGLLVLFITFEAPLSGMSMNPARTLASAIPVADWRALWIYFTAPPLGMLLAAEVHLRTLARLGRRPVGCAKLSHGLPCIFCGGL
jgi:aquaporin Z